MSDDIKLGGDVVGWRQPIALQGETPLVVPQARPVTPISVHAVMTARRDPKGTVEAMDALDAEDSLLDFAQFMWEELEPGRKFVRSFAIEAIAEHLEAVSRGELRKVLINVPPGFSKSLLTSVFWPAWEWGPRGMPWMRYIAAAYGQHLTTRDNLKFRRVIESPRYARWWQDRDMLLARGRKPWALSSDQDTKIKIENTMTGFKFATSVGGVSTGERGDRFIVDDPINVLQAESKAIMDEALKWFTESVTTRVNDATLSAFVMIMQRVAENDPSGHVLEHDLGFTHLWLPMHAAPKHRWHYKKDLRAEGELLDPVRFPEEAVEDMAKTMRSWGGDYAVSGQFEQDPTPRKGGYFQKDDFKILEHAPDPSEVTEVCRAWDLAATPGGGDYTVGAKMAYLRNGSVVVLDVVRGQWDSGEVDRRIKECAQLDGDGVVVCLAQDPAQAGKAQVATHAAMLAGHVLEQTPEMGNKVYRARPLSSQANAGNLYLVRASWNAAVVSELTAFPRGINDDILDALVRGFAHFVLRPLVLTAAPPTYFTDVTSYIEVGAR